MGDPKKQRKKYSGPSHPWQKERIEEEKIYIKKYGFKNKKEIWKMNSVLSNIKRQAKNVIASTTNQSKKESQQLLKRLSKLGLLSESSKIEDVLNITLTSIMDRRLQTMVFKKGFARKIGQARQFIVHKHIIVNNNTVTSPSYLVSVVEEPSIRFVENSSLSSVDHPERIPKESIKKLAKEKSQVLDSSEEKTAIKVEG